MNALCSAEMSNCATFSPPVCKSIVVVECFGFFFKNMFPLMIMLNRNIDTDVHNVNSYKQVEMASKPCLVAGNH